MQRSAAVLCQDERSLKTLGAVLEEMNIELVKCRSQQHALELVMGGRCSTLIVDFDLPGGHEAVRMANLLPPSQKPALFAVASRAWPGTGQAFQSGASRILYRPLESELIREALKEGRSTKKSNRRRSTRCETKTLVYLELETGTTAAVSIDIGEHGLALQATEAIPMSANVEFRCVLPGTDISLHGHADVVWASDQGRAGLFFTKLSAPARKHLKQWLHRKGNQGRGAMRDLLPSAEDHVSFAAEEELQTEVQ
jgi:FixJ family two-component response regulator